MPANAIHLIAGLGNPGGQYTDTRHNAGFMVLDVLALRHNIDTRREKFNVQFGRGMIGRTDVILAKPMAYMNRSGPPLQQLARYFKIEHKGVVIVHDDIDLAFNRLKIKEKGGDGGHKGIRSIIEAFGGGDFSRVRIGVGRSVQGTDVVDHVLGAFSRNERGMLTDLFARACDAIESILHQGSTITMNRFNPNSS